MLWIFQLPEKSSDFGRGSHRTAHTTYTTALHTSTHL
jgi:hypothetical protein